MKLQGIIKLLESLSIVAFGLAYWMFDIYIATATLIVAMTIFIITSKLIGQKLTKLQLLSWLLIFILGGATLIFRDENIIKWKPTVINSVVGSLFIITQFFGKSTLIERFLSDKIHAPILKLRKVNFACGLFFFLLAIINYKVAFSYSTDLWVQYKIFGNLALNMIFISGCLYYLKDYLTDFANGTS